MRSGRAARHTVKVEDLLRSGLAQAVERGHGLIDTRRGAAMPLGCQYHDAACRGEADRLSKNKQGLCLRVEHVPFDDRSRYVRHAGKRGNHFFEPTRRSEFRSFPSVKLPSRCIDSTRTWAAAWLIGRVAALTWMRSVTSLTTLLMSALASSPST